MAAKMDLFQFHAIATATWLTSQSLLGLVTPSLAASLLLKETRSATDLEILYTRASAITCLAMAVLCITLSGTLGKWLDGEGSIVDAATGEKGRNSAGVQAQEHTPVQKALLAATTLMSAGRGVLAYTASTNRQFSYFPLIAEMFISMLLFALGGGLLLFGTGAGTGVKGRSHALFDTPEHREEVKERHRRKGE